MKKSQVAGQIFVYVVAIFLASMILIYGYRAISGFIFRTEEISVIKFKTNLESEVKTIATDFGSVRKLDLSLPGSFEKVCFLQHDFKFKDSALICSSGNVDFDPIICDAWKTPDLEQNVFLIPRSEISISTFDLEIVGGSLCVPVQNGRIAVRLEGRGNRTLVGVWS